MNGAIAVGSRLSGRPPAAPASAFADAMSELAGGVAVVTCLVGGRPWGMTVTAFHSVSREPPIVLVSLDSGTTAAEAIAATGRFGVSVLAATQVAVARYASMPGAPKYLEPFAAGDAVPEIRGALAHLDCEVVDEVRVADHTVFLARVRAARAGGGGQPLVYHRRDYRRVEP